MPIMQVAFQVMSSSENVTLPYYTELSMLWGIPEITKHARPD